MAGWHLDTKMAQDIVARTMRIIDTNINVMDARGRIIGSGDRERIGELHEGALLVLSQGRVVDIDDAVARHLHGVRQGINLPLRLEGEIVGVIGLTGEPENLRKYGELVCMTAEMMLEQSRLMHLLAQDSRLREELVMNLIQAECFAVSCISLVSFSGILAGTILLVLAIPFDAVPFDLAFPRYLSAKDNISSSPITSSNGLTF